jgi:NADH-quinone oxidoreductase subunit E
MTNTEVEASPVEDVESILKLHPEASRDALIPILQQVQDAEGFISQEAVRRIAEHLGMPASKVYGVSTFYNQFRFEPLGKNHIQICRGTACHVKSSVEVLKALEKHLEVSPGKRTEDGLFSLEVVACIGACGLAPVISINGEFFAGMTPERVAELINEYREAEDNA